MNTDNHPLSRAILSATDRKRAPHGLARKDFTDANGQACSIQDSSVATSDLLWLGCDKGEHVQGKCLARMHLTRKQAATLASLLTRFADTGTIARPPSVGLEEE